MEQDTTLQNGFFFSVVMAVYNVAPFLEDAIKSIVDQKLDFKKYIQVILVDDGSTDESGKICDMFAAKYPKNICVIHKKNGGVSSARNEGIKKACGQYLNFCDADDKFDENTFLAIKKFINKHAEETDVVTVPLYFFDAKRGNHHTNLKFRKGSRVVDLLNEECPCITKHVNSSFFRADAIKDLEFDTRLEIGEDIKYCCLAISKKMKLGLCAEGKYLYRVRKNGAGVTASALQGAVSKRSYYFNTVSYLYEWIVRFCDQNFKSFPVSFQYLLADELYWRLLNVQRPKPDCLTLEEWETYCLKLKELVGFLSDKVILHYPLFNVDYKTFFMYLKHKKYPNLIYDAEKEDFFLSFSSVEEKFSSVSRQLSRLELMKIENSVLHIEGVLRFVGISPESKIDVFAAVKCDGEKKTVCCQLVDRESDADTCMGIPLYRDIGFVADIPLDRVRSEICIGCTIGEKSVIRKRFLTGKFFPLTRKYCRAYYYSENHIVQFGKDGRLIVEKCGVGKHFVRETAFCTELVSHRKFKFVFARLYYHLYNFLHKGKKKEYWLVSDRVNKADDNGEVFFEYLLKNKKDYVKACFFISKKCEDYNRLRKIGRVIPAMGKKYKINYLICDKVVSSSADEYITQPVLYDGALNDLVVNKKRVFLQHGVINQDLSSWVNKYNKNLYKFVTTTNDEYNSIVNGKYFYTEKEVILTGLPRYDKLYDQRKKYIAIMPTWRKYLMGANVNDVWQPAAGFTESEYFKFYNSLLNHDKLLRALEKYGYKILFVPHPIIGQCYLEKFEKNPWVECLKEIPYRTVFAESELLITDYSSVAFDFAYLRKPILYTQFDCEHFFDGEHSYEKGYFDYEKNGFGEVCKNLEETVDMIVGYIENGCVLKEKYARRIESTFPFNDRKNCERVFQHIF